MIKRVGRLGKWFFRCPFCGFRDCDDVNYGDDEFGVRYHRECLDSVILSPTSFSPCQVILAGRIVRNIQIMEKMEIDNINSSLVTLKKECDRRFMGGCDLLN